MELKQVPSGDGKIDVEGIQNQDMEFKDATSAAQAAAEAAERASKAARQAVELSLRGKFREKIAPDISNELNVKQQNKCSYDYDVVSTNSYTPTEGDSNVDLANEGSAVFDESTSQEDRAEKETMLDDELYDPDKQGKNESEVQSDETNPDIKYHDLTRKHVWGSAVSQRTKK